MSLKLVCWVVIEDDTSVSWGRGSRTTGLRIRDQWLRVWIDRSTPIGQMIDSYLKSDVEMEDHVIHLLFSANRWEAV